MKTTPKIIPSQDIDADTDWETLDSRVSSAVREIEAALEEALSATRDVAQWVERLRTLSAFMRQVESGLVQVRHQLSEPPRDIRPVGVQPFVPRGQEPQPPEPAPAGSEADQEPPVAAVETPQAEHRAEPSGLAAVAEAAEPPEPAEGEPPDKPTWTGGAGDSVRLEIESTEANIDLMVVERALRETPGVADVDLRDYAGKRATVQITFNEGEVPEETADPERLAAHIQERLAELSPDGNLSVSVAQ